MRVYEVLGLMEYFQSVEIQVRVLGEKMSVIRSAGYLKENKELGSYLVKGIFACEDRVILCLEEKEKPWYTENWYEDDLAAALEEAGVEVDQDNIDILKEKCLHLFDDKSVRNEMLADKVREIFK